MFTLISPAKINLFLRIIRRRDDGFHELASLFQTISLFDRLTFERAKQDQLTCTDPSIPCDHRNLVYKALTLFRQKTQIAHSYHIHIEKKIPAEAGLGGGSSNAATTLYALNELSNRPASLEQLQSWAAEIGSDVPFFLTQGTTYCTGRGDIMRPVKAPSPQSICIVKPEWGLSTPAVYKNLKVSELIHRDPLIALKNHQEGLPEYFNDLEMSAFQISPKTEALQKRLLNSKYKTVVLSGSGSAFFCILTGKETPIIDPQLSLYQAEFTNRKANQWYTST